MFGIPTLVTDYSNDVKVFDPNNEEQFKVDPTATREKNLYYLRKAMVKAYRAAGLPVRVANEVTDRNAVEILEELLNPRVENETADRLNDAALAAERFATAEA